MGLVVYNFVLEIPLPKSKTIALDEQTLIHSLILQNIDSSQLKSPVIFDLKGQIKLPTVSLEDFASQNPVIHMPEGSISLTLPLLSIKTKNNHLSQQISYNWNSTSPILGLFGFGTNSELNHQLLIKDNQVFYFTGSRLVEKFMFSSAQTMVGILNTSYKLDNLNNRYLLKDKFGISYEFTPLENNKTVYQLFSIFDDQGNRINYSYHTDNRIQEITSSVGQTIKFTYNAEGLVSELSNGNSEYIFKYHESKLILSVETGSGQTLLKFRQTHPVISTRPVNIETSSGILKLVYTLGSKISQILLPDNQIIKFNYGKNKTSVEFPSNNKVMIETRDQNSYQIESGDGQMLVKYDDFREIKEIQNNGVVIYKIEKNKIGDIILQQIDNDRYTYEYDSKTNIAVKITKNDKLMLEREIYDGKIMSEKNNKYGLVKYKYNDQGFISSIELEKGPVFQFTVSEDGQINQISLAGTQKSIDLEWEDSKLLALTTLRGEKFNFIYNANELSQIILPSGQSVFTSETNTTASIKSPKVNTAPIYKVKAESSEVNRIWPENDASFYDIKLDSMNRPQKISTSGKFKIDFFRNQNDALCAINVSGTPIFLNLDSGGRPVFYLSEDGTFANLSYNSKDLLTSIETEKDLRIFEYDSFERISQISVNTVLKYKFNYGPENSRLMYSMIFPDSTKVQFNYNQKNQLEAVSFRDSKPINIENQNMGKTKLVKFPNNVIQFMEYENDKLNFISITDSQGQISREAAYYFKDGQWVAGTDSGKRINIEYAPSGQISTFSEIPGVQYQYLFNDSGILKKMQTSEGRTLTIENNLGHNAHLIADSSKSSTLNTISLKGEVPGNKLNFFEVNGIGQIIEEKSDFLIPNLDIKPGTNSVQIKGFLTSGSVFEETLTFEVAPNASTIYSNNSKNRPEYKFESGRSTDYEWNSFNQLIKYTDFTGNTIEYRYLPDGRLASKTKNGKTQLFIYDPFGRLIEEIASTGTSIQKYVYNPLTGHILLSYDSKAIKYYHTDAFGNVINISNDAGKIIGKIKYHAYGPQSIQIDSGLSCPILFQGQYFDADTNLLFTTKGIFDLDNMIFWSNLAHQLENPHRPDYLPPFYQLDRATTHAPFSADYLVSVAVPYELTLASEFSWLNFLPNLPPQLEWLKSLFQN